MAMINAGACVVSCLSPTSLWFFFSVLTVFCLSKHKTEKLQPEPSVVTSKCHMLFGQERLLSLFNAQDTTITLKTLVYSYSGPQ